jgi:hypothetical protein
MKVLINLIKKEKSQFKIKNKVKNQKRFKKNLEIFKMINLLMFII